MADSINILVPKEAIDSIIQTDAAITKLDIVYRKMLTTIEQGSKVLRESAATQATLSESGKKAKEVSDQLDAASKKLKASEEALANFDKEKYAQTVRNTEALKNQQKEILTMVQAEKQLTGTIEKAEASTRALTAERKKLDLETVEGKKRLQEINTQLDKNTELIRKNSDAATKQRMNIGNYKSALEGLPGPLGAVSTTATTATRSLQALSKVPILAAVLAIVAAFAGLIKVFKSTEEGGDRINQLMSSLKGVMNVLKQAAQSLSLALADVFSGKFRQAGEHLKEGFQGIGGRMAAAAVSGGKLYDALDQIGSEKLAYNIEAVREKIAELRAEAAETTDDKERARLLREAIQLTDEMYSKEIDWSKRTAGATLKDLAVKYGKSAEELRAFTLLSYEERQKMAANDAKLADFANKMNDEGLAKLFATITEESKLRKEGTMETLRLRRTITSSEETAEREEAAIRKKASDESRKQTEAIEKEKYEVKKYYAEKFAKDQADADKELADLLEDSLKDMSMIENDWLKINLNQIETARLEELAILEQSATDREDYEKKKLAINRKYGLMLVQEQINQLKGQLLNTELTAEQQSDIYKKLAEYQLKLLETVNQSEESASKKWLDENEKRADELIGSAQTLADSLFQIANNRIESEIQDIETKRDKEIKAAGDSKEQQAEINSRYDKLIAEQELKKAKNQRDAALFQIAIETIVAAAKYALEQNWVMVALSAIIGAAQAGAVMAEPLPKFEKGTAGKFDTPTRFLAGEAGTEWLQKKTGEIAEVSQPTVFTNAQGMRVYSNPEIQQIERMMTMNQVGFDTKELKEIRNGIDSMARSLAGQKQYLMQNGKAIGYKQSGYTRKYLERMIG